MFRRQRFCGRNNRARECWKCHRDGPWVWPTTPRQYQGTVEQGNFVRWLREHLFGSHENHPGFDVLARSVPPVAAELPAEMPTTLLAVEGKPTEGTGVVRTNELELGVSSQNGSNELDIVVDSVEVPAVTNVDVVKNVEEFGSGQMKQNVCTSVEVLDAAGTRILPVCAPQSCSVEHADVRAAEQLPTHGTVLDVLTPEAELIGDEESSLTKLIRHFIPRDRVTEKIKCHLKATELVVLLRPANNGSTKKMPREACEKVILQCGTHENAKEMKAVFEEWRVAEDPIRGMLDDREC